MSPPAGKNYTPEASRYNRRWPVSNVMTKMTSSNLTPSRVTPVTSGGLHLSASELLQATSHLRNSRLEQPQLNFDVGSAAAQTRDGNISDAGPGVVDPKHPRVNEVNARKQKQKDRIANGERNGSTLTPGQAAHLENREQKIDNQEKADMAVHNSHLTKAEQRQLNKEQKRLAGRSTETSKKDPTSPTNFSA
jgi:hypothetical protein